MLRFRKEEPDQQLMSGTTTMALHTHKYWQSESTYWSEVGGGGHAQRKARARGFRSPWQHVEQK